MILILAYVREILVAFNLFPLGGCDRLSGKADFVFDKCKVIKPVCNVSSLPLVSKLQRNLGIPDAMREKK